MDKTGRTASFIAYDEATLAQLDPIAVHAMRAVPAPYAAAVDEAVEQLAQRAKVPPWVADPVKWRSLSRRERRALERHHKRETRRT
jgi:hypothetical protein